MPNDIYASAALSIQGGIGVAQLVVEGRRPLRRFAEHVQISPAAAKKRADRYRARGRDGPLNASSAPGTNSRQTADRRM